MEEIFQMNSKIGEMKEKENEEEEKSSEFQNLDTKQIKEMVSLFDF